jgi:hypothetical protein
MIMRTLTSSLMAMSLSCLGEGFDEEAADVENRPEKRERARRDVMVYVKLTVHHHYTTITSGWLSHVTVNPHSTSAVPHQGRRHSCTELTWSTSQWPAMSIARCVSKVMDRIAPLTLAEKWDNVSAVLIDAPQGPRT